ncbi:MlaD family protein [Campylobacter gastrosuis]|uniref:MlaD family protein n=1 Tax=Campylobacter gastrosuis TaxID=2974576 RepID=A0ABT7HPA1_9BACT|nr:MlaD family protein [Campylobacter gastrosuis]MDL0088659.1 MlaD family protein [Campylobacter gastrosuis]
MENRNSYTIVGLFFMTFVACFAVFMWWMSDADGNVEYKNYYIITNELPAGIRVESQVKFVGVVVGSVSKIEFIKDENIRLTLKIREDIPIKADSVADIDYQVISGISSINIGRGKVDFSGDNREIYLSEGLLSRIKSNAQTIGDKLNESLAKLDGLVSDDNLLHLANSLKGIDELVNAISSKENLDNLSEILKNLNTFTSNLNALKTDELNALITSINSLIKSANSVVNGFNQTQKMLNSKLESGEYDLKKSIEPTLNETSELLNSFERTLKEIRNALNRLEDNPYEFFFKDTSGDKK